MTVQCDICIRIRFITDLYLQQKNSLVEEDYNTSTIALQVVRGDEKGQCPGGISGPPCSWGI
jgi:hypothetical protein